MTAEEFKRIRNALGFSQEELADELGVSRVSVTRYENGTIAINENKSKQVRNLLKLKDSAA